MYSYNDFERLFVHYKLEGVPSGISIEKFCLSNKVPYNLFEKWNKDTRSKIIYFQVLGASPTDVDLVETPTPNVYPKPIVEEPVLSNIGPRILVDIRMSNGVHISQKNLSYAGLRNLVEKLEVLC